MPKVLPSLACLGLLLPGCASTHATTPATQLQVREYQTRAFDTPDAKLVMKAVLNTLQDEGFLVKSADAELGLLTASRESDVGHRGDQLLALLLDTGGRWKKLSVLEATVNVSAFGSETRVRLSFQRKTLDNQGGTLKVEPVAEPEFYQAFFAAVDKAVFIEKEKL